MRLADYQQDALVRARTGTALTNIPAIIAGFIEKGIPETDIKPRKNVLTFHAWKALGRSVKRGEHGVRVLTFVSRSKEIEKDGKREVVGFRFMKSSTVFHISQTEGK